MELVNPAKGCPMSTWSQKSALTQPRTVQLNFDFAMIVYPSRVRVEAEARGSRLEAEARGSRPRLETEARGREAFSEVPATRSPLVFFSHFHFPKTSGVLKEKQIGEEILF